jgi:ATP-dependent DNA ligase
MAKWSPSMKMGGLRSTPLQNYGSPVFYYAFDVLMLEGRDVRAHSWKKGVCLLREKLLSKLSEPIRYSPELQADLPHLVRSVREHKLEGLVAKRKNSRYESGKRSDTWRKMRISKGQELVIGGYIPGPHGFDSLLVGYYEGASLLFNAKVRNSFTPALWRKGDTTLSRLRNRPMPVRQFAGTEERAAWQSTKSGSNGGMLLTQAGAGRTS